MYGLSFLALKQGDLKPAQSWLDKAKGIDEAAARRALEPSAPARTARPCSPASASRSSWRRDSRRKCWRRRCRKPKQAHQKFPLSRMLARQYADALIADGKLDKAAQFLRDQVQQYREEPKLYDQLAKTYAAQGKIALQHMALAESYVLTGALPAARRPAEPGAQGARTCRSTTRP